MKLVVGLGNPGREYEATRHNAGFWWVENLAEIAAGPPAQRSQVLRPRRARDRLMAAIAGCCCRRRS